MSQLISSRHDRLAAMAIVAGWAAISLACGTLPGARLWGLNHLAFLPPFAWWLVATLAVAAIAFIWFSSLKFDSKNAHSSMIGAGIALLFLVMSWLARAATPLLGDGYLRADEAARRLPEFFVITDLLPAWITARIKQRSPLADVISGMESVALLSILAGVLFVVGTWWLWPRLVGGPAGSETGARERRLPRTGMLWLLSAGSVQLYFGYIELYALGAALLTLFALSVLAHEDGRVSWVWPVLFWAGAFWSHLLAIAWAPLLIWAVASSGSRGQRALRALCAASLVALSVALVTSLADGGASSSWKRHLLPLWGEEYSVADWRHIGDLLNLGLLLFPAALVLLISGERVRRFSRRGTLILLTAPTLFLLIFLKADLGVARDWDLFALISTPAIAVLSVILARESLHWPPPRVTAAAAIAIGSLTLWVWVNASETAARDRFARIVDLDSHLGSSGRELLARNWREAGRWDLAVEELGKALTVEPTARLAVQRGIGWNVLRNHDSALAAFRTAVTLDSLYADGQFGVGQSLWALGRPAASLPYLQRAVALDSLRTDYRYHLGMTLRDLGRSEEAVGELEVAAALSLNQPGYSHALAVARAESGDQDSAIRILRDLVNRLPGYTPAYVDLAWMLYDAGEVEEAVRVTSAYTQQIPAERWDPAIRRLIDSLPTRRGIE